MQDWAKTPNLEQLEKLSSSLKTLFWDMDGTLVNTEILHAKSIFAATKKLNPNFNLTLTEVENLIIGSTDNKVYRQFCEKKYLIDIDYETFLSLKDDLFIELFDSIPFETILSPNILKAIEHFKEKKIMLILVTSSELKIVEIILTKVDMKKYFHHIITREDTKNNKPLPEPYLLALKTSGFKSEEALILEDSDIGIQAAIASGIQYLKVDWY